jgi:hypothetical protein
MLRKGMQVMLVGLQSNPDLNKKLGELGAYLHDSQRWVVELPCGRKVKVREANIQTMDVCAQNFYHMFGCPDQNTPALADLVEERTGEHGRYLVAKQPISAGTYARDVKLRLSMSAEENTFLNVIMNAFVGQTMATVLQKEVIMPIHDRNWNSPSSYVKKAVQEGWLEDALVLDLMRYNCYSPEILQETIDRLRYEDVLFFEFWCTQLPHVPADKLWRLQAVLMTHAYLEDRTVTVGRSSYANCPDGRWERYSAIRRGDPAALADTVEGYGNFMELPPCFVQAQKGRGEIPADACIVFYEDISAGEELLHDYGDNYFLHSDEQLRHVCPTDMVPILFNIVSRLDPRVTEALEAHMRD